MILEIPQGFTFTSEYDSKRNFAYEKSGKLILHGSANTYFERLMYELTYASKDSEHCYYCGNNIFENTRTIDHQYPRAFGGISIPCNMVPCCSECNSKKGDLTSEKFKEWIKFNTPKKRYQYKLEYLKEMKKVQYSYGFYLPDFWNIKLNNSRILVDIDLTNKNYKGKKYRKVKSFFNKYGHLPRPIIISSNNFLLDGFVVLMFAKEIKISHIPTIILENVIVN